MVTAREIARRPFQRAGEVLETVPGVIVSQHSGAGGVADVHFHPVEKRAFRVGVTTSF